MAEKENANFIIILQIAKRKSLNICLISTKIQAFFILVEHTGDNVVYLAVLLGLSLLQVVFSGGDVVLGHIDLPKNFLICVDFSENLSIIVIEERRRRTRGCITSMHDMWQSRRGFFFYFAHGYKSSNLE